MHKAGQYQVSLYATAVFICNVTGGFPTRQGVSKTHSNQHLERFIHLGTGLDCDLCPQGKNQINPPHEETP
jgi:hypothetical protein